MPDLILYQTICNDECEELDATRWTCDTLRDAIADLSATRTSHVDGVECQLAKFLPWQPALLLTIYNGMEFRTGEKESRTLAIVGIKHTSARRLAKLLGFQWEA